MNFVRVLKYVVYKVSWSVIRDVLTWLLAWRVRPKGTRYLLLLPTASPEALVLGLVPSGVQRWWRHCHDSGEPQQSGVWGLDTWRGCGLPQIPTCEGPLCSRTNSHGRERNCYKRKLVSPWVTNARGKGTSFPRATVTNFHQLDGLK